MVSTIAQRVAVVSMVIGLLVASGGPASAANSVSNTWYNGPYSMTGITNPRAFNPGAPVSYTQYRGASFTSTPDSNSWVGVKNDIGDWCSSGGGSFPKKSTQWNWLWNSPGTNVHAMADWANASDCRSGGTHTYKIQGTHNEQNASVNYTGVTENFG